LAADFAALSHGREPVVVNWNRIAGHARMPLDRHARRLLDMVAAGKTGQASGAMSPGAMRQAFSMLAQAVDAKNVPGECEDRDIAGPAGALPLRIYTPAGAASGPVPALVFFHGGAGVFCGLDTHDGFCRLLAAESGCRVIATGYRLAPEHPFPAAIDDAAAATAWVLAHVDALGVDPARIGVAGDSAGATLAAVVCQQAQRSAGTAAVHPIALQVLVCPVTDPGRDSPSRRAFGQGHFFDMATLDWALRHYLPAGVDVSDERVSPLRTADLCGLPPAVIHTAEFDPFRDDGEAYAAALERAGVPVACMCHPGLIHHFYCMAGAIPAARAAIAGIGSTVRTAFAAAAASARKARVERRNAGIE
jgi:acetyl esterase